MFRNIRIAILLTILVIVAGNQWLTGNRLASWEKPLWITIYPVLADSEASHTALREEPPGQFISGCRTFYQATGITLWSGA